MTLLEAATFRESDKWGWRISVTFPVARKVTLSGFQTEQEAISDCRRVLEKGEWVLGEGKG